MRLIELTQPLRARRWPGYVLAILLSLLALWVRVAIGDALAGFPFLTFFLAVVLTAFLSGFGPGIVAMILTGALAHHYLFGAAGKLPLAWPAEWIAMGFYGLTTGTIVLMLRSLIDAHQAKVRSELELRALNAELERRADARTVELSEAREERALAEERLLESEQVYRYVIELSTLIPWTASAEGRTLSIGDRWVELTGCSVAESLEDGWNRLIHPDDVNSAMAAWRRAAEGPAAFDFEYRVRTGDGGYRWCRARAAARLDADGNVIRWYGTVEDIEDRRQAALRLQQVQAELILVSRLSAMGAMASTLAHELNQPLTAITNYVRGSQRMISDLGEERLAPVREAMAEADRNAVRAAEIIRRMRWLVARGEIQKREESLPGLVREACGFAMIDAASLGCRYRLNLDPAAAIVLVDRVQIEQVLINLLRNAADALRETDAREIVITTSARANGYCEVAVRDSGPGIAPEAAQRLFAPFNTTKTDGMGIGLSISRTIVEAHGGRIWTELAEGGGAVFRFTLIGGEATG